MTVSLLSPEEQSDIERWLDSDDPSRTAPLSAGYQGAVYLYEGPNGRRIVKEPADKGLASLIAPRMLRREAKAYAAVNGIAGIPQSFGMLRNRYLVLEFIEGVGLREPGNGIQDRDRFFAALLDIIKAVHSRNVSHNDLKRKDNILVDPDGKPVLLDFGMAVVHRRQGFWFRLLQRMDYNAWIKIKYHYAIDTITPEDLPYYRPTLLERGFRSLRKFWRTITFRQWRNARKERKEQKNA